MPITTISSSGRDFWDVVQVTSLLSAASHPLPNYKNYEYVYWYPKLSFTNIPVNISQDIRSFGNKFYMGELAYRNFGGIVLTEYPNWIIQQLPAALALPQHYFAVGDDEASTGNALTGFNQFFSGVPRARGFAWDLKEGVTFTADIYWAKGRVGYPIDGTGILQIL